MAAADLAITLRPSANSSPPTFPTTLCPFPFIRKPMSFPRLSCFSSSISFAISPFSLASMKPSSVVTLVARTSDWARQDEEEEEEEDDYKWVEDAKKIGLLDEDEPTEGLSDWEREVESGDESATEDEELAKDVKSDMAEEERSVNNGFLNGQGNESFPQPPEEAKIFVGNLSFDMNSEKLAHMFGKAGIVEVAEVIYNRETGQSRGFGFVNMSNVEEAEKAVEMFNRYEINGRLLSVNKAVPRGTIPEKSLEHSDRIYIGNLPWHLDDIRLEQLFNEHGKVVNARIIYDRETGRSRGFGFVTMASKSDHEAAIKALSGLTLEGRTLRVNAAEERPRRESF